VTERNQTSRTAVRPARSRAARVVIVGNSAAALSALESFRERDLEARVTMVSAEAGPAYSRVLLPYYLRRKLSYEGLFIRRPDYYARLKARRVFGARVEGVDLDARRLDLADGRHIAFDRLLLATGSSPARPPVPGVDGAGIHHLWTLADAVGLDPLLQADARVLVLGSGFVALQAAWAAVQRGARVSVVELEDQILPRVLDRPAARILLEEMTAHGVDVHTGTSIDGLQSSLSGAVVASAGGEDLVTADAVIVATGARPNDGLLPQCREEGRPGIPVSAMMETGLDGVFAAGDVVRGPIAGGGPREIHALWPTAVEQGKVAGANLAGAGLAYEGSLSMNVTEMFGLTVASIGRFVENEGDDVHEWRDLEGIRYLKLVARLGVPAGAIALGDARGASLLGRLRPFVRHGRPMTDMRALFERKDLDMKLVGLRAEEEMTSCASSS